MKNFLYGAAGALLVLISVALIKASYCDYSDRVITNNMIESVIPIQEDITSQLEESAEVSIDINAYSLSTEIKEIIVASDGLVAVQGGKAGQMFILIPSVANSTVTWHCVGGTHEYMPIKCRNT